MVCEFTSWDGGRLFVRSEEVAAVRDYQWVKRGRNPGMKVCDLTLRSGREISVHGCDKNSRAFPRLIKAMKRDAD